MIEYIEKTTAIRDVLLFTHPDQCTPETHKALAMLADVGILLGFQAILLKGSTTMLKPWVT